jgi:hypothetical protein
LDGLLATGLIFGMMAVVVLVFRILVRPPVGVLSEDPPGVRSIVVFSGQDAEFFADDRPDEPLVGKRLFSVLCQGLAAEGIGVENRGRLQNAQRAECLVEGERFALVLEWLEDRWAASVEWCPTTRAERRHLAWTHQVFAPPDSSRLRRLLLALDAWLKRNRQFSQIRWHRKEQWFSEDYSNPANEPFHA